MLLLYSSGNNWSHLPVYFWYRFKCAIIMTFNGGWYYLFRFAQHKRLVLTKIWAYEKTLHPIPRGFTLLALMLLITLTWLLDLGQPAQSAWSANLRMLTPFILFMTFAGPFSLIFYLRRPPFHLEVLCTLLSWLIRPWVVLISSNFRFQRVGDRRADRRRLWLRERDRLRNVHGNGRRKRLSGWFI